MEPPYKWGLKFQNVERRPLSRSNSIQFMKQRRICALLPCSFRKTTYNYKIQRRRLINERQEQVTYFYRRISKLAAQKPFRPDLALAEGHSGQILPSTWQSRARLGTEVEKYDSILGFA